MFKIITYVKTYLSYKYDIFIYSPWQEYSNSKTENKEKDLCSLVENILFVVMWRGVNIHNKSCWKVHFTNFYNFVIIRNIKLKV